MKTSYQKISLIYLLLVPVVVTALAFIIGHVSYKLYIPFWLANAFLMITAVRKLQGNKILVYQKAFWYLILPWALIAIFGGMGPPPETPAAWAALATEQYCRYIILMISGISIFAGFLQLHKPLAQTPGAKYSLYSKALISIALPLFIANMAYWGFFLTNVFIKYPQPTSPTKPEWFKTLSYIFTYIRMVEVAFIYLATAAITFALLLSKSLSKRSVLCYITFALAGAFLNLLPQNLTGPLAVAAYLSIIPAFTLLMPYLIGVNLAYKQSLEIYS